MTEYRNATDALADLSAWIMLTGDLVKSRAGDTREKTMVQVTLTHPRERGILIPERKASLPAQIAETVWVLSGRNDIEWLSNYLPRAADFSDDGKQWRAGYGPRLRAWEWGDEQTFFHDQLANVVALLRKDPMTRQAVMSIWDPTLDYTESKDIPCNNWLHFLQRNGRLDLHVAIRSNDLIWGWSGINQFEWSTLLEIVAGMTGFQVGHLTFAISSLHIYERHWGRAREIAKHAGQEYMYVEPARFDWKTASEDAFPSPTDALDRLFSDWFAIEEVIRTKPWDESAEAIIDFPEPMLRSWLWILDWYWHGDENALATEGVDSTSLALAAQYSPERKREQVKEIEAPSQVLRFADYVTDLHTEKHKAYGDSWKRRGEQIGIMANIARKIDRLGISGAGDTATDTAIDLFVYLMKYKAWLKEILDSVTPGSYTDSAEPVNTAIREYGSVYSDGVTTLPDRDEKDLVAKFERLEATFNGKDPYPSDHQYRSRLQILNVMTPVAFRLAYSLWSSDQEQAADRDAALQQTTEHLNDRDIVPLYQDQVSRGLWK